MQHTMLDPHPRAACLKEDFGNRQRLWPAGDVSASLVAQEDGLRGGRDRAPQGILRRPGSRTLAEPVGWLTDHCPVVPKPRQDVRRCLHLSVPVRLCRGGVTCTGSGGVYRGRVEWRERESVNLHVRRRCRPQYGHFQVLLGVSPGLCVRVWGICLSAGYVSASPFQSGDSAWLRESVCASVCLCV